MDLDNLQGKVIAVTGGASGIGLGIVRKLILLNAKVAVADISQRPAELHDCPHIMYDVVDVSSRRQVHEWMQRIVLKFGRIDGMCPNAGISPYEGGIVSDELYQRIFAVCVTGVWNCGTEAYWQFKKQGGGGVLVITSSGGGLRPVAGLAAYCSAKHAVVGLTRAWALEWAQEGIRVNSVAPGHFIQGLTETAMQKETAKTFPEAQERFSSMVPMGRIGKPSEVADAVIFLLGKTASYVTGHILVCDGGLLNL
ncbi:hypothetical protein H2204_000375 [Knufia peltigerae]|uniref:Uncharacterized protein n=1 Tax=Knufia peltigerae TaxID=1002370 RepID=A0AA39D2Z3_9EURO|nr:hypothetical protein H2204_000375 [Knufia peltigerae]